MTFRRLNNKDHAVVGIVTTFLIIGLIVIILSILQTTYIPKWMEQTESEHMDQVADQFAQLKFSIDTQAVFEKPDIPIATSIKLGSKEHPFLMSNRAYGSLEILTNASIITITDNESNTVNFSLGIIKYESSNAYFIDQSFIYETGATIVSQSEGNIMTIKPTFTAVKEKNTTLSFTIIDISPIGGKRSISGYGSYPIQTEFFSTESIIIDNISSINFQTKYPNSWSNFFNRTLTNSGLNYNGYATNFTIIRNDQEVLVDFSNNIMINIEITYVTIGAQIAPGWIENIKG